MTEEPVVPIPTTDEPEIPSAIPPAEPVIPTVPGEDIPEAIPVTPTEPEAPADKPREAPETPADQ